MKSKPIIIVKGGRTWKYVTPLDRFEAKYIPEPNSGCWLWTGASNRAGYGMMMINYRTILAHRFSYQTFKAPLNEFLVLDHLCRNRCCVNPDHLEQVTQSENARRIELSSECSRGHPWTVESTWFNPRNGWRQCRKCNLISQKATQLRKKQGEIRT
jgi:hypothetical protein